MTFNNKKTSLVGVNVFLSIILPVLLHGHIHLAIAITIGVVALILSWLNRWPVIMATILVLGYIAVAIFYMR